MRSIRTLVTIVVCGLYMAAGAPPWAPAVLAQTTQPGAAGESAAAALMAAQVPGVTPGMTLDALVKLGYEAYKEMQLHQAQQIFAAVVREEPRNAYALLGLASTFETQAQQAKKSSDPAVAATAKQLGEEAGRWYLAAAPVFREAGDHGQAGRCYQRVLAIQPKNPTAQLGAARASAAQNQDVAAIEQFKDYLKNASAPPDTIAQANLELAQVYRRSRLPALAIECLNKALTRDRENPEIYIELARTYKEKTELKEALAHADTAVNKSPNNPDYRAVRAQILLAQGELAQARRAIIEAITLAEQQREQKPDNQAIYRSLAGYYSLYSQVLQQILNKDTNDTLTRIELARTFQRQAEMTRALALYQAMELLNAVPVADRRNPRLLEAVLEVLSGLGLIPQGQSVASQLLQIEPNNSAALQFLQRAPLQPAPTTQTSR